MSVGFNKNGAGLEPVEQTVAERVAGARPRGRIVAPREHGAWAMLLVPYAVGTAVGHGFGLPALLFMVSMLAFFSARQPLTLALKRYRSTGTKAGGRQLWWWLAGYCGVGLAAGIPIVLYYGRLLLLPLAGLFVLFMVVEVSLSARRLDRTAEGELFAIAAMALAAPAAFYVSTGTLDVVAGSLWLITFLYSAGSVFYVKMKVRQRMLHAASLPLAQRLRVGLPPLLYVAVLAGIIAAASVSGLVPVLAFVAFLPLIAKVIEGIARPRANESLKRVGLLEVGYAALFTMIAIAIFNM